MITITNINISYCDITIDTDHGPLSVQVSKTALCGESFGVRMYSTDSHGSFCQYDHQHSNDLNSFNHLIDNIITNISQSTSWGNVIVQFDVGNGSYCIKGYVKHNGYYPHDYTVLIPDDSGDGSNDDSGNDSPLSTQFQSPPINISNVIARLNDIGCSHKLLRGPRRGGSCGKTVKVGGLCKNHC